MPKFLYTIILLAALFWGLFIRHAYLTEPNSLDNVLIFHMLLLLALMLTLSLPIYIYFHIKAPTFSNLRFLYRKSIKWSTYLSLGVISFMILRAFRLDNIVNISLFLIMYVLAFLQMRTKR
jgi:hypothetical protein